jgi:hypothetical protein
MIQRSAQCISTRGSGARAAPVSPLALSIMAKTPLLPTLLKT